MLTARRRLRAMRAIGEDAGITLVELLVTMVLMSVVSALALTWLIGESSADTKTQNASFATGNVQVVLQSWPALLHVADSPWNGRTALATSGSPAPLPTATLSAGDSTGRFLAISSTSITFNANLDNAPAGTCEDTCSRGNTTQVTLALSGGGLTQTLVQGTGAAKTVTFVHSGAALAGGCLFTAYDVTDTRLGCSVSTPLGAIARIVLAFTVSPDGAGTAQTFSTGVTLTGSFASVPTASPSLPAGA